MMPGSRWAGLGLTLLVICWLAAGGAIARAAPDTGVASYQLSVSLDPATKQIHGTGTMAYRNPSADPLTEIWLHLYLNAFRSPDTLWLREASATHRGQPFDSAHPGWIQVERLALAESGAELAPGGGDPDETNIRIPLPEPLPPGGRLSLEMQWTAQLPRVFARTGYAADFVLAGQWYPKLAVYDRGRWDTEPWHANAEFFADFGSYDLSLTVPAGYVTGASGVRTGETDNPDGTKTVRYQADRITDLAWTAWPEFRAFDRQIEAAGESVELEILLPPDRAGEVERHIAAARAALDGYGRWYGPYPWPKLTVVVPPPRAEGAGGMEYPSLVTTGGGLGLPFGLDRGLPDVEQVTVHEIAHQWFPMQVQSNESTEAWLDEGFADYLSARVLDRWLGPDRSAVDWPGVQLGYVEFHRALFLTGAIHQRLDRPSWRYPSFEVYGATVYSKGSLALRTLERTLGDERFTTALRFYADRWRWRHPTTPDLQAALEESTGERLGWFFDPFVSGTEAIDYQVVGSEGDRATIGRSGAAGVPVEIRLTLADGSARTERWDGATGRIDLDGGQPIVAVAIDPEERVALEADRLNNDLILTPDPIHPAAVASRWLALIQALLQLGGTIG